MEKSIFEIVSPTFNLTDAITEHLCQVSPDFREKGMSRIPWREHVGVEWSWLDSEAFCVNAHQLQLQRLAKSCCWLQGKSSLFSTYCYVKASTAYQPRSTELSIPSTSIYCMNESRFLFYLVETWRPEQSKLDECLKFSLIVSSHPFQLLQSPVIMNVYSKSPSHCCDTMLVVQCGSVHWREVGTFDFHTLESD